MELVSRDVQLDVHEVLRVVDELVDEVPVAGVDLDPVEARPLGALGAGDEGLDQVGDLGLGERPGAVQLDGGGEIEGLRGRVGKVERETHDDGDGFVDDTEGIR